MMDNQYKHVSSKSNTPYISHTWNAMHIMPLDSYACDIILEITVNVV